MSSFIILKKYNLICLIFQVSTAIKINTVKVIIKVIWLNHSLQFDSSMFCVVVALFKLRVTASCAIHDATAVET